MAVLGLLLGTHRLWAIDELGREIGNAMDAHDAVARLHGAGLIHRLENFVFASRPAVEAARLVG